MRLRVQINRHIGRVELPGEEPTLADLRLQVQEVLLTSLGLSPDTEFTLSLNGTAPLAEADTVLQTLSSCGIVSGDLIIVLLSTASPSARSVSSNTCSSRSRRPGPCQINNTDATTPSSGEPSSRSGQLTPMRDVGTPEEAAAAAVVYTWEPVLCSEAEEGKAPRCLEVLHNGAQSRSPADCLMVAVHLLMLETGFVPRGSSDVQPGGMLAMPAGWRMAGGGYRLHYTHPLCEDSLVMLNAVSMGAKLFINVTLKIRMAGSTATTTTTVGKLSLSPSGFVSEKWAGPSAAVAFNHLRALSRTFKDQLVFPLIATASMALPAAFGLAALPPEVLLPIMRLLDVHSLVALSSVSRRFRSVTADNLLWRHIYQRDFHGRDGSSRDTDWRDLYKREYKSRQDQTRRRTRRRVCQRFHPRGPMNPIPNPYPDPDPYPNPLFPHPRRHNSIGLLPCQAEPPRGASPGRHRTTTPYGGRVRRGGGAPGHDNEKKGRYGDV